MLCVCVCAHVRVGPCSRFLGVGGDLDGQLDALLQGISCALVDGLHGLDVHAADHQVVLAEAKTRANLHLLIEAEHGRADDPDRVLQTETRWLNDHVRIWDF